MSEAKHTPGPWEVERLEGSERMHIVAPRSHSLAMVFQNVHLPPERADADARLMAAAPELLEALQEVMGWIRNWDPSFTADEEWSDTQAKVDAAIAKATGKAVER